MVTLLATRLVAIKSLYVYPFSLHLAGQRYSYPVRRSFPCQKYAYLQLHHLDDTLELTGSLQSVGDLYNKSPRSAVLPTTPASSRKSST